MCYMVVIAVPASSSDRVSDLSVGELTTWLENNDSIAASVPPDHELHCVGVGRHCSCGCVRRVRSEDRSPNAKFVLDEETAELIARAVEVAGSLAFVVHWASGEMRAEEFVISFGPGFTPHMLFQQHAQFEMDQLVWVST